MRVSPRSLRREFFARKAWKVMVQRFDGLVLHSGRLNPFFDIQVYTHAIWQQTMVNPLLDTDHLHPSAHVEDRL